MNNLHNDHHRPQMNGSYSNGHSSGSAPKYLWIDCSDHHCTPNDIIGIAPHNILVYKNLAHQVNYTDLNCLSLLQYAVQVLAVEHIIICGHYNCAALKYSTCVGHADLVETWLQPIRDLYAQYAHWLDLYRADAQRLEKLCELNVIEQVLKLCNTSVVQNAWQQKRELTIHGWAYAPDNGFLNKLTIDIGAKHEIFPAYHAAIHDCIGKS